MHGTSTLQIDLDAITHNVGQLRALCAPGVRFCAVLKADAYGLGANGVLPTLTQAGSSMVAVFSPAEACKLDCSSIPILVLMPVTADEVPPELMAKARQGDLHFVVHDATQMESLGSLGRRLGVMLPVHLKIDTGLHRGGCSPRDAVIIARAINRCKWLKLRGLMTHFAQAATSDQSTSNQMRQLDAIVENLSAELSPETIVHASGTCGALRGTEYHADMIRIGLGWSGYLTPSAKELEERLVEPLRPAVSWKSRISLVRTIGAGERVGYGGAWVAKRPTRLGLVPVGYANGYPLDADTPADGGPGLSIDLCRADGVSFASAPVIGRINMDQMMVDLTEIPEEVHSGMPVELISSRSGSPCQLSCLSRRLKRSPHSILVQINNRVERLYVHGMQEWQIQPESPVQRDVSTTSAVAG